MHHKIQFFIISHIFVFFLLLFFSFSYHNYTLRKKRNKEKTFLEYINNGKFPKFKELILGLSFGVIFGLMDNIGLLHSMKYLEKHLPGDSLTKAGLANTYSDIAAATIGTFTSTILADMFDFDDKEIPIWSNTIGIFIGCLLGLVIAKTL